VTALAANLVLVRLPFFGAYIDGLARAYAISLVIGFAAAAVPALQLTATRPSWRDMIVIAAGTVIMAIAVRPLNAVHPPLLAAGLSLVLGGAILVAAAGGFDVGDVEPTCSRVDRSKI
jgi:hypothetical protein